MRTIATACTALSIFAACATDPDDDSGDGSDDQENEDMQDIIGGTATYAHPEIGLLSLPEGKCTGTLISGKLVLTAGHCVNHHSQSNAQRVGTFTVQTSATVKHTYHVVRYLSYDDASGDYLNDIAIIQLETPVPVSIVHPAPTALRYPAFDSAISVWGYGEIDPFSHTGFGRKRKWSGHWNGSIKPYYNAIDFVIASGDLGGPLMNSSGQIVGVASQFHYKKDVYNYFAEVPPARAWVISVMRYWG